MGISNLDETIFTTNLTKESSYLLGFIWGDGYLYKKTNKVTVEIISKDFIYLEPIVNKVGKFTFFSRKKISQFRKPQCGFTVTNRIFFNFLLSLGYGDKSYHSHKNILEFIPEHLKSFWLRGFFDADGCIYYNKENYCLQSTFCSSYEQDWSFFSDYLTSNNIKNTIIYRNYKKTKHSVVRIIGKKNNLNLFNLLYENQKYDFGYKRKFDKFAGINYNFRKTGPKV